MVLKDRAELPDVWSWIRDSAAENLDAQTCLLLVGHDVDAIAASTMLTKLLEDEPVPYKTVSVKDYRDLSRIYVEQIAQASELRSIVLLNCGGIIDLLATLQEALDADTPDGAPQRRAEEYPHRECRWFVLDSHRPYSLENLTEEDDKVFVIHDGEDNRDMDELMSQVDILTADTDAEDASDEEEEPPSQRRRLSVDEYNLLSPDSRADQRAGLRRLCRRYYSASWHGTATSLLLWSLVQSLNKTSNELLWLAIVGLSDQLVHERIEFEKYTMEAQLLQTEVAALNQDGVGEQTQVTDEASGVSVSVRQHLSSSMKLDCVQELRVSLMRHWSLYDALYHSSYIASRLGLYQTKGRTKLDEWLARMGVPLDECKQEYSYMRKEYKDPLYDKMLQYGAEFGLINLTYPSFRRISNYTSQLAAADLVVAVTAMLEAPGAEDSEGERSHVASFASAKATLCSGGVKDVVLREGLEKAKVLVKATVAQGQNVLTQRLYQYLGDFYYVVLKPGADTARFLHPQALTKLALFVADALREGNTRRQGEPKPLLMAAPNPERSTHLVVAVLGSARHWKGFGRNAFGTAFHAAASDQRAHIAHDGFESSVCTVASADLQNFINGVVIRYNGSS